MTNKKNHQNISQISCQEPKEVNQTGDKVQNIIDCGESNLTQSQQKFIEENLGNDAVTIRFNCVRHGETEEFRGGKNEQSNEAKLTEEAIVEVEKFANKLNKIIISESTVIYHDPDTARTVDTAKIIQEGLKKPDVRNIGNNKWLLTSDKIEENASIARMEAAWKVGKRTLEFKKELKDGGIKNLNIILCIHRGTVIGIEAVLINDEEKKLLLSSGGYKNVENREIDLGINYEVIKYKDRKELLFLNSYNYKEILSELEDEELLRDVILGFKDNKIQIWELQNYINAYLKSKPELFDKYLGSRNEEIGIFCMANLIEKEDKQDILEYYIKNIELKGFDQEIIEIFKFLYSKKDKSELWKTYLLKMIQEKNINHKELGIEEELFKKFIEVKKVTQKSNQRSQSILDNSLDKLIKTGDIIDRRLYFFERKSDNEIKELEKKGELISEEKKYDKRHIDINQILNNDKKISVILANVGEGKSTELVKIKDEIDKESSHLTLFYTSKDLQKNDTYESIIAGIERDLNLMNTFYSNESVVLFLDGIDELDSDYKNKIKDYLEKLPKTYDNISIILGSRKSEYYQYGDYNYNSIGFEELQEGEIDDFLKSRLKDDEDKKGKLLEINSFLESNILDDELKNSPLVLFLLTKLSVEELKEIKNKASLYEKITIKIITEHNNVSNYECSKFYLPRLGKIAYDIFKGNDLEDLPDEIIQKYSILFKKVGDNNYEFIHRSFYEYFLARYLADDGNGNKEIFDKREQCDEKWNEWRNIRPIVSFYGEILINNEDFDKLNKFLGKRGILNNDDIFGEGFFMGLEILFKYEKEIGLDDQGEKLKKKYLDMIQNWKEYEVFIKKNLFVQFQEKICYEDNEYVDLILKHFWYLRVHEYCSPLAELGAKKGLDKINNFVYKSSYNRLKSNYIPDEFCNFVKKGNLRLINLLIKFADDSFKVGNYKNAEKIYSGVVKECDKINLKKVIEGADKFFDIKEYDSFINIYIKLLNIGEKKIGDRLLIIADQLFENNEYDSSIRIYIELLKNGNKEIINKILSIADYLFKIKKNNLFLDIYIEIIQLGRKDLIQELLRVADDSIFCKNYKFVINIYTNICKICDNNILELIFEKLNVLKNEFDNDIVYSIIAHKYKIIDIDNSVEFANKFVSINKVNFAISIYENILKVGDKYTVIRIKDIYDKLNNYGCIKGFNSLYPMSDEGKREHIFLRSIKDSNFEESCIELEKLVDRIKRRKGNDFILNICITTLIKEGKEIIDKVLMIVNEFINEGKIDYAKKICFEIEGMLSYNEFNDFINNILNDTKTSDYALSIILSSFENLNKKIVMRDNKYKINYFMKKINKIFSRILH